MANRVSKHQAGLLAIGLVSAGFAGMYLGVRVASELWSTLGLMVTAAGALAVIFKF